MHPSPWAADGGAAELQLPAHLKVFDPHLEENLTYQKRTSLLHPISHP
jgi:hypothetical protein